MLHILAHQASGGFACKSVQPTATKVPVLLGSVRLPQRPPVHSIRVPTHRIWRNGARGIDKQTGALTDVSCCPRSGKFSDVEMSLHPTGFEVPVSLHVKIEGGLAFASCVFGGRTLRESRVVAHVPVSERPRPILASTFFQEWPGSSIKN